MPNSISVPENKPDLPGIQTTYAMKYLTVLKDISTEKNPTDSGKDNYFVNLLNQKKAQRP